jgi:uncharacterized protein (TIGR02246 family)
MNLPKNAADVHAALANAFNTGDPSVVMGMYELDGIIVPEPGKAVSGREKFEAAIKAILSIKGKMEIRTVYCLQTGDLALGRSEWNITDGDEVRISSKGIELMRRGTDGTWKVLIDHAFGALEAVGTSK